jgi:hypothetical protein
MMYQIDPFQIHQYKFITIEQCLYPVCNKFSFISSYKKNNTSLRGSNILGYR